MNKKRKEKGIKGWKHVDVIERRKSIDLRLKENLLIGTELVHVYP